MAPAERPARRRPAARAPPDGGACRKFGRRPERIHPPLGPLTGRSNDGNDGETESCEEKGAQGRSQGAQDQAGCEEGCDQTRSSGGRGSRTASAGSPGESHGAAPGRARGCAGSSSGRPWLAAVSARRWSRKPPCVAAWRKRRLADVALRASRCGADATGSRIADLLPPFGRETIRDAGNLTWDGGSTRPTSICGHNRRS